MTVSSGTGAGRGTAARATRRFSAADAALIGGGAVVTALVAAAATRSALAAARVAGARRARRARHPRRANASRAPASSAVLTALLVSLPALALLGPSFALPFAPQAFLFRIVLAVVVYAGVCYLLLRRDPMPFAAKDLLLPAALWFVWLLLGLSGRRTSSQPSTTSPSS